MILDAAQIFALPIAIAVAQKTVMVPVFFIVMGAVPLFLGRMEIKHSLVVMANGLLFGYRFCSS